MNEDEWDVVYDTKAKIEQRIQAVMEELTKKLTPEQDTALRTQLTEEFRFWK